MYAWLGHTPRVFYRFRFFSAPTLGTYIPDPKYVQTKIDQKTTKLGWGNFCAQNQMSRSNADRHSCAFCHSHLQICCMYVGNLYASFELLFPLLHNICYICWNVMTNGLGIAVNMYNVISTLLMPSYWQKVICSFSVYVLLYHIIPRIQLPKTRLALVKLPYSEWQSFFWNSLNPLTNCRNSDHSRVIRLCNLTVHVVFFSQ